MRLDREAEWTTLALNDNIPKTISLAAVELDDKIVLLGGYSSFSFCTCIFNKEGELERDLSDDFLTPGEMCMGSFAVEEGKIYAVGNSELEEERQWGLRVFDGKKWAQA